MLVYEPRSVAHHLGGGAMCVNEQKERKFTTELRYIAAHSNPDALSAAACTHTFTHTFRLQTAANGKRRPRGTCQLPLVTDHFAPGQQRITKWTLTLLMCCSNKHTHVPVTNTHTFKSVHSYTERLIATRARRGTAVIRVINTTSGHELT